MSENNELSHLQAKLDALIQKHNEYSADIRAMNEEIKSFKSAQQSNTSPVVKPAEPQIDLRPQRMEAAQQEQMDKRLMRERTVVSNRVPEEVAHTKSDFEKFIGENLINKIGIAITVIGVSIGAKYSIDNNLISPLMRIILGYLMGLGLMGFGIRLKEKYESYSAVLVSGAISILYFMTFSAYDFYALIPQSVAFLLMFVFTTFSVVAATNYNRQIIAHIGLVGAYAIPFLLSDGSGRVGVLFSYMVIINIGVLVIAFKRYWKPLYYVAYGLSWLIFMSWFGSNYHAEEHFGLALLFSSLFFAIFYAMFLAYKCIKKEIFETLDVFLILSNSFIFYAIGYAILSSTTWGYEFLGLFTLGNAVLHFGVSLFIYQQKLADRNLFYLITGLVLVFITMAIPVQLDGYWVTIMWACEAALLFWIGRTKQVSFYEYFSYPLILLSFLNMIFLWGGNYTYSPELPTLPIFNVNFLTNVIFLAAMGFVYKTSKDERFEAPFLGGKEYNTMLSFVMPSILLVTIYFAFRMEVFAYFNQWYYGSMVKSSAIPENAYSVWNEDINRFQSIALIIYSAVFLSILSYFNIHKIKNRTLGTINLAFNLLLLAVFLTQGLLELSELRESYLNQNDTQYFSHGVINICIRYISYGFIAMLIYFSFQYIKQQFLEPIERFMPIFAEIILSLTIVWVASSELITWLNIMRFGDAYKIGLSILWGVFALGGVALGIWKGKKHLRIAGIVLFAVTLLKLFLYDIADLGTIAKTIVFVSLGILLLIISFLYNKYKDLINNDKEV
jgi:uncharacterized membrane protein